MWSTSAAVTSICPYVFSPPSGQYWSHFLCARNLTISMFDPHQGIVRMQLNSPQQHNSSSSLWISLSPIILTSTNHILKLKILDTVSWVRWPCSNPGRHTRALPEFRTWHYLPVLFLPILLTSQSRTNSAPTPCARNHQRFRAVDLKGEIQPRFSRDSVEIRSKFSRDSAEIQPISRSNRLSNMRVLRHKIFNLPWVAM